MFEGTATAAPAKELYATGTEELSARVLAARERVGRKALAAHLGISQSACWRWERNKVHPGAELQALQAAKLSPTDLPAGKPVSRSVRLESATQLIRSTKDLNSVRDQLLDLLA
jgi:hypothetical protein